MKKSFVFYSNWAAMIDELPDDMVGQLLKMICRYEFSGEVVESDPIVSAIFKGIRPSLDMNTEKYQKKVDRMNELNAKRKTKSERNRDEVVTKSKRSRDDIVGDTDTVTDTDTVININKRSTPKFKKPTVDEVRAYCNERRNGIDAQSFIDFYDARGWKLTKGVGMKDWKAAIRTWEKNRKSNAQKVKPPERDYDFDALELKLLNSN